jgi:hypothetical protein
MFETEQRQMNTTPRQQKFYIYVFGSFEIVLDVVLRI